METWRKAWRTTISDLLPTEGLIALQEALETNSPELLQGSTCFPPPLHGTLTLPAFARPVEAACALAFTCWKGEQDCTTVREVENRFAEICREIDIRLGEDAASRFFINWYDDTPRDEMRKLLLGEVNRTLEQRKVSA